MALTNFAGAVSVVTGGASGIGLATARALYSRGAHIVLADVNAAGLQEAEQQVRAATTGTAGEVLSIPVDVRSEEQVEALMQQTVAKLGRIDLVVTSAGIGRSGPVDQLPAREVQAMMDINFMGTYHCVRAALPTMRRQQAGHFVMLSSVAGKLAVPYLTGYCASKWAVRGFASAVRAELYGTNIGITTVYPSWVDTPMIHQEDSGLEGQQIVARLKPEQVAEAIIEAVTRNQRDLTLAPDTETARALAFMQANAEQAEDAIGRSFQQRQQPA